jgi:tryptophan 2,3-dioxygenase
VGKEPRRQAARQGLQGRKLESPNFHQLRHSFASALALRGADLLTISKLLGNRDQRTTSLHYAHLADASLRKAVAQLPQPLQGPDARQRSEQLRESRSDRTHKARRLAAALDHADGDRIFVNVQSDEGTESLSTFCFYADMFR